MDNNDLAGREANPDLSPGAIDRRPTGGSTAPGKGAAKAR